MSSADRLAVDALKRALTKAAKEQDSSGPAFAEAMKMLSEVFTTSPAAAINLCLRAAKGSDGRRWVLCDLWLERGAQGCAICDAAVAAILADPHHPFREDMMSHIDNQGPAEFSLRHKRFAPQLRLIARDENDPLWAHAINVLCRWLDRETLDIILDQCTGITTPFVLLAGLVAYRAHEAVIVFEMNLHHPEPRTRTYALWGLAALGYDCAIGTLVGLLDDPDITMQTATSSSWEPGQALRAAQALADVFDLPFAWHKDSIAEIKALVTALYTPADIAHCQADLAAGRFVKRAG